MKIAIIILNYNSSADCRKCIGFLKQQESVETEIVVVDNCSPLQSEQTSIKQLCEEQGCTFIQAEENRGYNAGNNIGLRYAAEKSYKYALIANPDMEFPQTDYLKQMVEVMEQDRDIAVCGSDIITPEGKHQNPMREISYHEELFWPITILRNHKRNIWFLMDYTKSGYCDKVSGCCFMIRISFIQEISFFDEKVFLYSEEPILAKQVVSRGYKVYYMANIQAVHRHIKSEKGDPKKRMRIFMSSRMYYLQKYSGYSQIEYIILNISLSIERVFIKFFLK